MAQYSFIFLLLAHFIGDFVFQSRTIANNKSTNLYWLLTHGLIYMIPLLIVSVFIFPFTSALLVTAINVITHLFVDNISGKFTSLFYKQQKYYYFFTTLGLDQFIHISILYLSYIVYTNV
jgi:hypothetical protein